VRDERFPWPLGALLVLLIVGGIGFWLGSSSVAPVIVPVAAPAPIQTAPVYPTYAPQSGGFPIFGLLFGLFVLFVIFKVIRHAVWSASYGGGHSHRRGYGHGPRRSRDRRGWEASDAAESTATWPRGRAFWANKDVPPMVDEMFQRWHSRMHTDPHPGVDETQGAAPDAGQPAKEDDAGSLTLPATEP
jgi:hypothetical protein